MAEAYELLIKSIGKIGKRGRTKDYKPKKYFDLDIKARKRLLQDFDLVSYAIFQAQHNLRDLGKWWGSGSEAVFVKGFKISWLSYFLIQSYVSFLGMNSITDTFLNDSTGGKRGALADLREHLVNPFLLKRLKKARKKLKRKNHGDVRGIINDFPLDLSYNLINLWKFVKYKSLQKWLPVQFYFARVLPGKRWWWKKEELIEEVHLSDLEPYLQKGDILLQRTNFQLTNATMPGFWTHTMLYDGKGHIIESTPYKVRRVPWKKTARADYLCVLRPKCSEREKISAVRYAKSQVGKPYDLNFDFLSDEGLVCTELVLKSYPFLNPKLKNIFGRLAFPSSHFIELFNEGKLEFVYFLDAVQRKKRVFLGTEKELSKSYLRSKWDLLQK